MNRYVYILILIIIIIIILIYFYTKTSKPLITIPPNVLLPKPKTKYLLTEQAIMMTFPKNYKTPYSTEIFNSLLNQNINTNILNSYPNSIPFDLNCYVLHTPVFIPNMVKRQGGYYDQSTGNAVNNLYENIDYYDIIGAYFFINFNNLLNANSDYDVSYYDSSKQIVIDPNYLIKIFNNLKADSSYNQSFLFSKGEMPILLDEFVPKISMFLFYALGINNTSKYVYKNMLDKC